MTIRSEAWGEAGGRPVHLYTLAANGLEVSVATYGGVIVRMMVPDSVGNTANVTLGYDSVDGYINDSCYFGCIVGRVANRIGHARFTLDGTEHVLDRNHGDHQLHGGARGFHARVWNAQAEETPDGPRLRLTRTSPDGEQGYPGTVEARVDYTLLRDGLRLDFVAATDKPTPVNMTNHSYFNLSGRAGSSCLDHRLSIPAGRILETDTALIPTGGLAGVAGTPFDFRSGEAVGARIMEESAPLSVGRGYDHYFVLDDGSARLKTAATVYDPASGRAMEVGTTHPGVQFYSGNHIPEGLPGCDGARYVPRCGFCLEAHGYVDAPNHPGFPPVTLLPGETMHHTIIYKFSAK
jgi:aldose 1-epimerase